MLQEKQLYPAIRNQSHSSITPGMQPRSSVNDKNLQTNNKGH